MKHVLENFHFTLSVWTLAFISQTLDSGVDKLSGSFRYRFITFAELSVILLTNLQYASPECLWESPSLCNSAQRLKIINSAQAVYLSRRSMHWMFFYVCVYFWATHVCVVLTAYSLTSGAWITNPGFVVISRPQATLYTHRSVVLRSRICTVSLFQKEIFLLRSKEEEMTLQMLSGWLCLQVFFVGLSVLCFVSKATVLE